MVLDTTQLPVGAQISKGDTKNALGVIEEGFVPNGDVLAYQAEQMVKRNGIGKSGWDGANFSSEVVERVQKNAFQGIDPLSVNQATLNAIQSGEIKRDGYFTGNNATFTGYYLN